MIPKDYPPIGSTFTYIGTTYLRTDFRYPNPGELYEGVQVWEAGTPPAKEVYLRALGVGGNVILRSQPSERVHGGRRFIVAPLNPETPENAP